MSDIELSSIRDTLSFMETRYGYDENSARDVIGFIVSQEKS